MRAGDVISRFDVPDLSTPRQTAVARDLFPDGVSSWGSAMALGEQSPLAATLETLTRYGESRVEDDHFVCTRVGAETAARLQGPSR